MTTLTQTVQSANGAMDDEPNGKMCCRCQGNGEIVIDWDRYRHPRPGDVGDEAVAQCPDCDGEGVIFEAAALKAGGAE